ncbi:MAG TPA: RNA 2',3'-cyclic phosphodiesterase [Planctomycetaceae bacterium]|nr:RNA 2',3'-cyclic phosphodiesterase [Planctomycetaceae bacterium]
MSQRIRTFVAVPLDEPVRCAAVEVIGRLRSAGADVKWVEPEHLHVTLKFLGEVDRQRIDGICAAVRDAAAGCAAFELRVQGAGAFPDLRRPRTLWLGATRGVDQITTLAGQIESRLAELGFDRERRPFHPHVTVGRLRRAGAATGRLTALLREQADTDFGTTGVREVVVFSSHLSPSGPRYEPLAHAPLRA